MIHRSLWPAYRRLLARSDRPILVGPFRGEVGFEALYWIPFVRRFAKTFNVDPNRLIPITRGGAAALYGMNPGPDLYTLREPRDLRVENRVQHAKYRQLKQTHWTDFDREVIRDAAKALGLTQYHTLHPGWMFARLGPFFDSGMSLRALEREALFDPLWVPALPDGVVLPEKFVAVRFYLRHTYPPMPQLVQFAQESIKQIAAKTPVVLLHSGIHADEHMDIPHQPQPNVFTLPELSAETNLATIGAILGRALGFVGTYGGLAQLALRLGKPSVSYFHEWEGTSIAHKHLADAIALRHTIPCIVQKVGELPLLQTVAPLVAQAPPTRGQSS